jgi:hypothetical protein
VIDGRHLRPFGIDVDRTARVIPVAAAARLIEPASSFGRPRVCYRDVASASNRLTLIAALLPRGVVSTHTVFCAKQALVVSDAWCLVGLLNSLVANYLVRLQMGTHVNTALMARLPIPRLARGSAAHTAVAALARILSRVSIEGDVERYGRLNAIVARAYGLSPDQYAHVVSTFPLLPAQLRGRCIDMFEQA